MMKMEDSVGFTSDFVFIKVKEASVMSVVLLLVLQLLVNNTRKYQVVSLKANDKQRVKIYTKTSTNSTLNVVHFLKIT